MSERAEEVAAEHARIVAEEGSCWHVEEGIFDCGGDGSECECGAVMDGL
jgi:hypothetical protein